LGVREGWSRPADPPPSQIRSRAGRARAGVVLRRRSTGRADPRGGRACAAATWRGGPAWRSAALLQPLALDPHPSRKWHSRADLATPAAATLGGLRPRGGSARAAGSPVAPTSLRLGYPTRWQRSCGGRLVAMLARWPDPGSGASLHLKKCRLMISRVF
jgi:hypothetical protein